MWAGQVVKCMGGGCNELKMRVRCTEIRRKSCEENALCKVTERPKVAAHDTCGNEKEWVYLTQLPAVIRLAAENHYRKLPPPDQDVAVSDTLTSTRRNILFHFQSIGACRLVS